MAYFARKPIVTEGLVFSVDAGNKLGQLQSNNRSAKFLFNNYYMDTPSTDFDKGDEDFSFGGWVYWDGGAITGGAISKWDATGNNKSYTMDWQGSGWYFRISSDGVNETVLYTGTLAPKIGWHFVVFVHDSVSDLIKASIDGAAFSSLAHVGGAYAASTRNFEFGRKNASYFAGRLDNIFFYDKAMTIGEIGTLYNGGAGLSYDNMSVADKVGLVSFWKCNEGGGTRKDAHGTNDLTVQSGSNSFVGYADGVVTELDFYDLKDIVGGALGTPTNGATIDNDVISLDGINDYIDINSAIPNIDAALVGDFTVSIWCFIDQASTLTSIQEVFGVGFSSDQGLQMYIWRSFNGLYAEIGNSGTHQVNPSVSLVSEIFDTGNIFNYTVRRIGTTFEMFYNNVSQDTFTTSRVASSFTPQATIGAISSVTPSARFMEGGVKSLLVYNRGLSNAELTQNFDSQKSRFI